MLDSMLSQRTTVAQCGHGEVDDGKRMCSCAERNHIECAKAGGKYTQCANSTAAEHCLLSVQQLHNP